MDLNILEVRTGEIIGDPVKAHKELTGESTKWFEAPEWCRGRLHAGDYFKKHSEINAAFLQSTDYTRAETPYSQSNSTGT